MLSALSGNCLPIYNRYVGIAHFAVQISFLVNKFVTRFKFKIRSKSSISAVETEPYEI